jgi:hypothetical protein
LDLSGDLFSNKEGTYECILNAVLDVPAIYEFLVTSNSSRDLNHGCIEKSTLATNTTLKKLDLCLWED